MSKNKIYVDFQSYDYLGRLLLDRRGTVEDLKKYEIELSEGLVLIFYSDDLNDQGEPDELIVKGQVTFDSENNRWVAIIDWNKIQNESSLRNEE